MNANLLTTCWLCLFGSMLGTEMRGADSSISPGTLLAWGRGFGGQLGDGVFHTSAPFGRSSAIAVSGLDGAAAISAGIEHSIALRLDGSVWVWGAGGNYGQLGTGALQSSATPVQAAFTGGIGIVAGENHNLALKADGTVWAWGFGAYGQVGRGIFQTVSTLPAQVSGLTAVIDIAAGGNHSLALKADGTVWAWGYNAFGQLGNGTFVDRNTPVQVTGLNNVVAIASGTYHNLAIRADGTLWAWGRGAWGQLGNGTYSARNTPVQVQNINDVVAIDGGFEHSLAVRSDGTVWAWGRALEGQLGHGIYQSDVTLPVQVSGLANAVAFVRPLVIKFTARRVPRYSFPAISA